MNSATALSQPHSRPPAVPLWDDIQAALALVSAAGELPCKTPHRKPLRP